MCKKSNIFLYGLGMLFVTFLILLFANPLGPQLSIIGARGEVPFDDFFNVMIYIADNNPYFNELNGFAQKPYLPISYVIMDLFSSFGNYSGITLDECYVQHTALIGCYIFTLFSVIIFLHSIYSLLLRQKRTKLVLIVFFSSVFWFSVERGNLMMLTVAMMNYFISYYDSPCKKIRYFSLLALCLASVLKVYPVIWGLLLLKDKRYRDIAICVVVSLLLTFIPFLYFENGFNNIPQLLNNINENSTLFGPKFVFPRYGFAPGLYILMHFVRLDENIIDIVLLLARLFTYIMTGLSIWLFMKKQVCWKTMMIITISIIMFPANSGLYSLLYIFPALFLYLNSDTIQKKDYIYLGLLILTLNPIQFVLKDFSVTYLIANFSLIALWILLIVDILIKPTLSLKYE